MFEFHNGKLRVVKTFSFGAYAEPRVYLVDSNLDTDDEKYACDLCIATVDCNGNGYDPSEQQEADAERLVACWNALEGYNPDALRDVVEALRNNYEGMCEGFCADFANLDFTSKECEANCGGCKSRAALARLEGGAS